MKNSSFILEDMVITLARIYYDNNNGKYLLHYIAEDIYDSHGTYYPLAPYFLYPSHIEYRTKFLYPLIELCREI